MELQNRNVVITGGSQGIGEAMADRFASQGANVFVIARSADKLKVIADRVRGRWMTADLAAADGVDGLVQKCLEQIGHIDVWVNNAGLETTDAFVHVDRDHIRTLARLNFEAPLMLTRDVLPHMIERGTGHIVQISSLAGTIPFPGLAAYSGTKAGLTNFTETLRLELKGTGVGVTVVAPGPVDTPMWDRLEAENWATPALKRFRQLQFLPKVTPEDTAAQVVDAVANNRRFVRPKNRFQGYHMLNNAPRRLVENALFGVKMAKLSPKQAEIHLTNESPSNSPDARHSSM